MFTTFAAVLLATAAAAQAASSSASAPAASATGNAYIPSSASPSCQAYLQTLDSDQDLAKCTASLISATAGYGPNGTTTSATKAQITSTLGNICSGEITSACPQSLITGKLADFHTACGPELISSPNPDVKARYDTIYFLIPFLGAVCSTDNNGEYCVPQAPASGSTGSLTSREEAAYLPNASEINKNNVLLLSILPSLPQAQLCTQCTAAVLKSYMSWEAGTNYAPGLSQSTLVSGQPPLYNAITSTCGADFLSSAVKAAGSLGQGSTTGSSGALPTLRASSVLAMLGAALASAVLLL